MQRFIFGSIAVTLVLSAGCSSPAVDDCCACLVGTAPDGSESTDADANCLDDDNANGDFDDETEKCPNTMAFSVAVGGDNASVVKLKSDGCREVCFDACSAVDPQVGFQTPVVSAGSLTATVGGVAEDATNVTVNEGPHDANFIVNVSATTPVGSWNLLIGNLPRGTGSYPFAPFTDFGITASTAGNATGTYEIAAYDERHIEGTFAGTIEGANAVSFTGAFAADFTLNDGDVSGLLGLQ